MVRTELDMIRDILGWPASAEQKLGLIRQIVGGKAAKLTPAPARKKVVKAKAKAPAKAPAKIAAKAPAQAPAKVVKRRKRSLLRGEGSAYTLRSVLWAELKRLAPEKAAKLSYARVSTRQLEPMVEEAKKKS